MKIAGYNKRTLVAGDKTESDFETKYIALRRKENRIYSNEEVRILPDIDSTHVHYNEWLARKESCKRLIQYLRKKNKPLKILEIGCGNGWLSSRLAEIENSKVIGLDINLTEIQQAEETFDKNNLRFLHAGIENDRIPKNSFDIIVFAASIQYFNDPEQALLTASSFLHPAGEIHILDTHFYPDGEAQNACVRTQNYYAALGFPGMSAYYFHHEWQQLKKFNYKILYNPGFLINRIMKKKNSLPWIKIKR